MQQIRAKIRLPHTGSYKLTPLNLTGIPLNFKPNTFSASNQMVDCPQKSPWALVEQFNSDEVPLSAPKNQDVN